MNTFLELAIMFKMQEIFMPHIEIMKFFQNHWPLVHIFTIENAEE
jgi:hypothetical protein